MSDEQKQPSPTFYLRFQRGYAYDIQYSGDASAEAIDLAIEALKSFKRACCPENTVEPAPTSDPTDPAE